MKWKLCSLLLLLAAPSLMAAGKAVPTSGTRNGLEPVPSADAPLRTWRSTYGELSGRVLSTTGRPISGAQVLVDDVPTTTDSFGRYVLPFLDEGRHLVRFQHPRFLDRFEIINIRLGHVTSLDMSMIQRRTPHPMVVDDSDPQPIVEGPIRLDFPPRALVLKDVLDDYGRPVPVTGQVDIEVTPIDPSDPASLRAAPAPLLGRTDDGWMSLMRSYMMFHVDMYQNGQALEVAPGALVGVSMRLQADVAGEAGDTIPMWSIHPDKYMWVMEDAEAEIVWHEEDGSVTAETVLSHFSDWNCDRTGPAVAIDGTLSGTTFQSGDQILVEQVDQYGKAVSAPFAVYSTPAVGGSRFFTNIPQCGMKDTTRDAYPYFKMYLERGNGASLCTLGGKSRVASGGANGLRFKLTAKQASSTDPNSFLFSVDDVCKYLEDSYAHIGESSAQKYSFDCAGNRTLCDGNVCGNTIYISSDTNGNPYDVEAASFGDCSGTMLKASDGLDDNGDLSGPMGGVKLDTQTAYTSFYNFRLPMDLFVASCQ